MSATSGRKVTRLGGAATRSKVARRAGRLVLALGLLLVVLLPVSWERLPEFGLVFVPPTDDPPEPPGPGIDPTGEPPGPRTITPTNPRPSSTTGEFLYFEAFGDQPPYVSNCEPIPFEIRTGAAPANGDELVYEALQRLADASGLSFEFMGYTTDPYEFNQRSVRFDWERERKPLWVGWATAEEVPDLGPRSSDKPYAVGVGGPVAVSRGSGQMEIIGGGVVLRAGEALPPGFGTGPNSGNVLLHELGHAMGLDHIMSEPELMYPQLQESGPDGFGLGDTRGLQGITAACG
jgi:hypothetical protein